MIYNFGMDTNKLKQLRKDKGLTLKDVADRMNVTEATVQRWESGNIKSLRQGRISQLAEILDASPADIMGWKLNETVSTEDEVKRDILWRSFKQLTEDQQRTVFVMINALIAQNGEKA